MIAYCNQEKAFTSGHNVKPPFLPEYLVFFKFIFSEVRDDFLTITLLENPNVNKIIVNLQDNEVYGSLVCIESIFVPFCV